MYKTITLKTLISDVNVKPLIDKALSTYPLYTPINEKLYGYVPTREELNNKIINHYKYRQIGFETIGRFVEELEITMNEIMPYYNQLYKSIDVMNGVEDIFGNLDVVESYEEQTKGISTGSTKDTSKTDTNVNNSSTASSSSETNSSVNNYSKHVKSETPQNDIDIISENINTIDYADEVNWTNTNSKDNAKTSGTDTTSSKSIQDSSTESNQSVNSESTGTTSHTLTRKGNQGVNTYAHDLLEFRELFVNVEQQIINDLRIKELFLLVF